MQPPVPSPHDRYFKGAMSHSDVAKDFFLAHLPSEVMARLDMNSLQLCPGSYLDEELQHTATDVLYQVDMLDNKPAFVYILAEHQRTVDRWMVLRLWQYSLNIFAQYRSQQPEATVLPLLIPLVFYNGNKPYNHSTRYADLFTEPRLAEQLWLQGFRLVDLTQLSDDTLRAHQQAHLMQYLMKHAQEQEITHRMRQHLLAALAPLLSSSYSYIQMSVTYLFDQYDTEQVKSLLTQAAAVLPNTQGDALMNIAERLRQEGREQGMLKGETTLLHRLLERKFGQLSSTDFAKLHAATAEQLLSWGDRVLEAETIAEVFNTH